MTTDSKTISHFNLFAITDLGEIRLGVFGTLEEALDYRVHAGLVSDEVWAVFTDGSSELVD